MSDEKPQGDQQEPTMEEILASIRRIISDDEEEAEGQDGEEAETSEDETEDGNDEDVLELTDVVDEDGEPEVDEDALAALDDAPDLEPEIEPVSFDEPEPVVEMDDEDEDDEYELVDSVVSTPPAEAMPDLDTLLSAHAATAATDAFSGLTGAVSSARGIPLGNVNKTLEDIVKELLRPMLKEWLDENLPALVERMVEKEIVKIVGRADGL